MIDYGVPSMRMDVPVRSLIGIASWDLLGDLPAGASKLAQEVECRPEVFNIVFGRRGGDGQWLAAFDQDPDAFDRLLERTLTPQPVVDRLGSVERDLVFQAGRQTKFLDFLRPGPVGYDGH